MSMGLATQDPNLVKRLDVDKVAQNLVNYILATDIELKINGTNWLFDTSNWAFRYFNHCR